MQRSGKPARKSATTPPAHPFLRGVLHAALAVAGLLVAFAVIACVLALTAHSFWAFPLAVVFAYTVGVAIFVLSPGRGNKGYNPFGLIVRRALGPLLRLHAVYVVLVLVAFHLKNWMWAHASPWWTTPNGSRHTTRLGTSEFVIVLLFVFTESLCASILLSDAELKS